MVWYLSGLTCTHANVTEKGEYRARLRRARPDLRRARHQPARRGRARRREAYDFGQGAGFYVDATQEPWATQLPHVELCHRGAADAGRAPSFPADMDRQAIIGHSMGGHGALTVALRHPGRYRSVSAFAPIVAPSQVPWGKKALGRLSRRRPRRLAQA